MMFHIYGNHPRTNPGDHHDRSPTAVGLGQNDNLGRGMTASFSVILDFQTDLGFWLSKEQYILSSTGLPSLFLDKHQQLVPLLNA
jgi:hypothetical protein